MNLHNSTQHSCIRGYIHSVKGGIYLLELEQGGVSEWAYEGSGLAPMRFQSLVSAREYARNQGADQVHLSQDESYEEMIGLASPS